MNSEFLSFWIRETCSNIKRNRLMSVVAVSTVTIGLFILGGFYLTISNLSASIHAETQKLDLTVFLKPNVNPARRKAIYSAVRIPQVASVVFVSKNQALLAMKKTTPELSLDDFKDFNPLGDEFHIKIRPEHINEIFKIQAYYNTIKGVTQAKDNKMGPVHALLGLNSFVAVAGIVATLFLGLAILLIIHNSIRLTIFARRREIHIMEMVGATAWFIRIPFLMEGVLYGLAGAVVATVGIEAFYLGFAHALPHIMQMDVPVGTLKFLPNCVFLMLVAGIAFGVIGSWVSLARSLDKALQI